MRRKERLRNELIQYSPKRRGFNFPIRDYTIRLEDIIPALSGFIGKTSLVAAFAIAWMNGYGIDNVNFVVENVRLEIIVGCLFCLIFTAFFNPYAAPPGTLAPLVPLVPLMASMNVHPLVLGLLVGLIGLIATGFRLFQCIIELNGEGARGGIILLFGIMGAYSSINNLIAWGNEHHKSLYLILMIAGVVSYIVLSRLDCKWLIIPTLTILALLIPSFYHIYPEVKTLPSFPIINPKVWWFDMWGLGWGFSSIHVIRALPFALLAVIMWPSDALAIQTIQETKYGEHGKHAVVDLNATFISVSLRNIVGSILGGVQTAAIWRSFMIPLSIIQRPIGGSAFLMGVIGILLALFGAPLDFAVFPPVIWLVLLFGVYVPLLEVGFHTVKSPENTQIGILCIVSGLAINPVIGWVVAILVENLNLLKSKEIKVSTEKIKLTIIFSIVIVVNYFVSLI